MNPKIVLVTEHNYSNDYSINISYTYHYSEKVNIDLLICNYHFLLF